MGQTSKEAGRYVLDSIQAAVMALRTNRIDALVFVPFNKQSMKLAGLSTEDELQYFAQLMDYKRHSLDLSSTLKLRVRTAKDCSSWTKPTCQCGWTIRSGRNRPDPTSYPMCQRPIRYSDRWTAIT